MSDGDQKAPARQPFGPTQEEQARADARLSACSTDDRPIQRCRQGSYRDQGADSYRRPRRGYS